MAEQIVIVGAGQAGGMAALGLRKLGFAGSVDLVGGEPHIPYERPPLSKSYLAGEPYSSHDLLPHEGWYAEQDVTLRRGVRASEINRTERTVALDDGTRLGYDKLLIATGSQPRRLPVPDDVRERVFYLRTLEDSRGLGARLRPGARITTIGGGWIGLEVAAVAAEAGCQVTVIDPHEVSLQPTLGATIGGFFTGVHREHGVEFRFGRRVAGIDEVDGSAMITLDDGSSLSADCVVVGIGAVPQTDLVDSELLAADGGIQVDTQMRTAAAGIFAAGDVASVTNPFYRGSIRSEHWANAHMGGKIAAKAMLGLESEFDPVPFFFTDQYDLYMEYAGWVERGQAEDVVIRGDLEARSFQAFWLVDGRVAAAMHVNRQDEGMEPLQDLIREKVHVDRVKLADSRYRLVDLLT